jgi:hypothetical protein
MTLDIAAVTPLIRNAAKQYPEVKFSYQNAVDAMRLSEGLSSEAPPKFDLEWSGNRLDISSDKPLWGPQPFFCFSTWSGQYFYDNLDKHTATQWSYYFDWQSIDKRAISKIGVASNDDYGNTTISRLDLATDKIEHRHKN